MRKPVVSSVAALLLGMFTTGCETDSDWIGANPGRFDYVASQKHLPECAGQNGPQWTRLDSAPPQAEEYLRHAKAVAQSKEVGRHDTWFVRNPGEVMLCRSVDNSDVGAYSAFWRFREKDGVAIVAESYAWQYVVVN